MTVDVQLDGQEQSLSLGEFEAKVRDGTLGADVPVRIAAITGDRWVAACTLQIWTSVADSPEARFQRSWARPATPWMTALVVGGSVRVFAWLWGTLPGAKVADAWARSTPSILELGQSWRLYTYGFLHAGPAHLLMNMLFLGFIGVALETLLGAESIAALYLFAVVGGGTMSTFFSPGSASVGASGGDFGFLLAAVVLGWRYLDLLPRGARSAFGASVLWFSGWGFVNGLLNKETDNWCHLGGLVCGLLFGMLVRPIATPGGRARNRLVSLTLVALVTIWLGVVNRFGPQLLPYATATEDGLTVDHPAYWEEGSGTNQDLGWASPTSAAAITARTLRHSTPLDEAGAVDDYLTGWRSIAPDLTVSAPSPITRDGVPGVRLTLTVPLEGRTRSVIAEVYPRGRYVQSITVESALPDLLDALSAHVYATAHIAPPTAVTEQLAAAGSGARGLVQRAQATADLGDLPRAIDLYRQALQLAPKDPKVREAWLAELVDWGRPEAVPEALDALAALPDSRSLRAKVATVVAGSGDLPRALAILDEGLAAAPGDRALTRARAALTAPSAE